VSAQTDQPFDAILRPVTARPRKRPRPPARPKAHAPARLSIAAPHAATTHRRRRQLASSKPPGQFRAEAHGRKSHRGAGSRPGKRWGRKAGPTGSTRAEGSGVLG